MSYNSIRDLEPIAEIFGVDVTLTYERPEDGLPGRWEASLDIKTHPLDCIYGEGVTANEAAANLLAEIGKLTNGEPV